MAAEEIARRRLMWRKIMAGAEKVGEGLMEMLRALKEYHTGGVVPIKPDTTG